ncbi:hypothetical protein GQF01_32305 [Paenibacillus sp. 5J-6]|uniref:DUF1871 domain-containing protein n=1 Tax=Paenibacillus silvestris TaxID=2606219 RepID=A0A6L8VAX7_9BACL|nr:hypothetical protein [Paenibacillus silvestris]MZQ86801.1 hypothetical protein [Paenibacillus silvestris]
MKFRAVSEQTKMNYMMWSIRREIIKENAYLNSLPYDPTPIMEIVKQLLDAWDPIGLLDMNALDDEYDGETRTLTIYITKHLLDLDAHNLNKEINKLFRTSFGEEYQDQDTSVEVAAAIVHTLRTNQILA